MKNTRAVIALIALVVAGCGSGASSTASTSASPPPGETGGEAQANTCSGCAWDGAACSREVAVTPPPGWYEGGGAPIRNRIEPCEATCCAAP